MMGWASKDSLLAAVYNNILNKFYNFGTRVCLPDNQTIRAIDLLIKQNDLIIGRPLPYKMRFILI